MADVEFVVAGPDVAVLPVEILALDLNSDRRRTTQELTVKRRKRNSTPDFGVTAAADRLRMQQPFVGYFAFHVNVGGDNQMLRLSPPSEKRRTDHVVRRNGVLHVVTGGTDDSLLDGDTIIARIDVPTKLPTDTMNSDTSRVIDISGKDVPWRNRRSTRFTTPRVTTDDAWSADDTPQ